MRTELTALSVRPYRDDADWGLLHDLVVEAYRLTGRWRGWTPDRIDGFLRGCLFDEQTQALRDWRERIRLWEAPSGQLVGAVHWEGPEEAWLELHPGWLHLAPELLDWAEADHRRRHATEDSPPALGAYASSDDQERQALLARRGYIDRGPTEVLHGRSLDCPLPALRPVPGYVVRRADVEDRFDRRRLIEITRLVFNVTFDDRVFELEHRMRTHREYLVAEAADGTFAAWCGVWAVPEVAIGMFEPVGTHADHRRRSLASLVMAHGLDWMRGRGLRRAFVGTGVRNTSTYLYASLGFSVAELNHQWELLPATS